MYPRVWCFILSFLVCTGETTNTTVSIDCGQVPFIANGVITLVSETDSRHGALANVTCDEGYEPKTSLISCTEDGTWETPSCQAVDCGDYDLPFGSTWYASGTSFGSISFLMCDEGYKINGLGIAYCETDGLWRTDTTCELDVDCNQVPAVKNGAVTFLDHTDSLHEALADVTCDLGYEPNQPVISCTEESRWEMPVCRAIDCGEYKVAFGKSRYTSGTTFGSTVTILCDVGYEINGASIASCGADGSWNGNTTCEPVDCGQVPAIANGVIRLTDQNDSTYGALAEVTCDIGYQSNLSIILCTENATWETTLCQKLDCGQYNLAFSSWFYIDYGSSVYIICYPGYLVNGTGIAFCQPDGSWSSNTTCEPIDCGQVPVIRNGDITLVNQTDSTYEALAYVTCDVGYESNSSMISCTENGTWEMPDCRARDCGAVPVIDFGIATLHDPGNTNYGASAAINCNVGFEANTSTILCLESGEWDFATCTAKDCGKVRAIDFGIISLDDPTNSTYGASASVKCSNGFETDTPTILCLASGVWDSATCIAKDCGNVPTIDFGTVSLDDPTNSTYGSSAFVSCIDGFKTNMSVLFCQESGVWQSARCTAKDCGNVPTIDFGTITLDNPTNTTYGASASINCRDGYKSNALNIFCLASGIWDNAAACTVRDCGNTPHVDFGEITLDDPGYTTYGASASVNCNDGYESDTPTIFCLDSGVWEIATCSATDCGDFPAIDFGIISLDDPANSSYGGSASVRCNVGFVTSTSTILCLATGVWDSATCIAKDCGNVPTTDFGTITLKDPANSAYGASASVYCVDGFETNTSTIICLDSGVWQRAKCTAKDCGASRDIDFGGITLVDPGNTTYGASASVSCSDGFEADTSIIVCLESGVWENATCTAKDCGIIPAINFGIITLDDPGNTTYNASASVNCSDGFETDTPVIFCLKSGVWENAKCTVKDCTNVPNIKYGVITPDDPGNTTYGASASVNCIPGFETNTPTILCLHSGIWANATCVAKDCGTVPVIEFGTIALDNPANSAYGASASIRCIEGFETRKSTIFCLESGVWDSTTCAGRDCAEVPAVDFGVIILDDPSNSTYGSSASVSCRDGFETNTSNIYCLKTGVWSSAACIAKDCGNLPNIDFGKITLDNASNSRYGASAAVYCNKGFETSTSTISCLASGVWENAVCTAKDCGIAPTIEYGRITPQNAQNTTYGAMANVSCNTGYNTTTSLVNCTANGTWQIPSCKIKDCGNLTKAPENGSLVPLKSTTYMSVATYTCKTGYQIVGNATRQCLANATWSSLVPTCKIRDCGTLSLPENGRVVNVSVVTTYGAKMLFACNEGYSLVGDRSIECLNSGKWSGGAPSCYKQKPKTCLNTTDTSGTMWPETPISTIATKPCQVDFEGNVTRYCNADGIWQLPKYRCVRKAVEAVNKKVETLAENATAEEVNDVLREITKVTSERSTTANTSQKLTEGDITVLTTSLEKVADVISETDVVNENITDSFIESASNLIDTSNQDSWKSLSATNDSRAGKVLAAVESIGTALARSLKNSTIQKKPIVKKNLALEVEKVSKNKPVSFPSPESINASTNDTKWIAQSQSKIILQPAALKDDSTEYVTTAVMYRDISEILPSTTTNKSLGDSKEEPVINGPVLSLSITPSVNITLDPPVTITFEHDFLNLSAPQCAYWNIKSNSWSTDGCFTSESNESFTTCKCNHLTNFAVLMSPFKQADASSKALRIISMVGIGISSLGLIITFVLHLILWRYLKNDRSKVLMNLCIALLLGYALFLGGLDRTENQVACTAIAAMLHYIFLVVFSTMLVEGILIAVTVLYVFQTKSRVKELLILAWVLPAVIVGVSLGATKTSGYGNKNFCWLSSENGLVWAFVGPASSIIVVNIICLLLVIRALFGTKAMETKKLAEKVRTSLRSLGVLVPLMGVSWIVGIFYVNESFYFVQYIFATLNSLQGFFIFLFHCLLNEQVKKSIGLKGRKKSSATWLKSSMRSTAKDYESAKVSKAPEKSYADDYSRIQHWRDKLLENTTTCSGEETDFTSPKKIQEPQRLSVTLSGDSTIKCHEHGRMSGTMSEESPRLSGTLSEETPMKCHEPQTPSGTLSGESPMKCHAPGRLSGTWSEESPRLSGTLSEETPVKCHEPQTLSGTLSGESPMKCHEPGRMSGTLSEESPRPSGTLSEETPMKRHGPQTLSGTLSGESPMEFHEHRRPSGTLSEETPVKCHEPQTLSGTLSGDSPIKCHEDRRLSGTLSEENPRLSGTSSGESPMKVHEPKRLSGTLSEEEKVL